MCQPRSRYITSSSSASRATTSTTRTSPCGPRATGGIPFASSLTAAVKISAWVRTIPTGPEDHDSSPWSVWITTTSTTIRAACARGTSIGRFST